MAAFDTTSAPGGSDRVASLVRRLAGAIIQWNDLRVTRKALSELTVYELDDIGLTPGDVVRLSRR